MGTGQKPGISLAVNCTEKISGAVILQGDGVAIEITGTPTVLDYFKQGKIYGASFTPGADSDGDDKPDDGSGAQSAG